MIVVKEILKRLISRIPALYQFIVRLRLLFRVILRYGFDFRVLRLFWDIQPYTMVGHIRLFNTYELSQKIEKESIEGAFVECGVWRGGCSALLAFVAQNSRTTWLFDSFEGMPEPVVKDGEKAAAYAYQQTSGRLVPIHLSVATLKTAEKLLFSVLRFNPSRVRIVKGWFQNTLPAKRLEIGQIALLRLDADFYESTFCILKNLYDNVVSGGYIIIDDYGSWEGCRKATDEFFDAREESPTFSWIDTKGVYFRKP